VVKDRGYFEPFDFGLRRQKCRNRIAHSPAMKYRPRSPVAMCGGSFEGRRSNPATGMMPAGLRELHQIFHVAFPAANDCKLWTRAN